MVPPHPGPLIAVNALHADLGQTIGYGILLAIPTVIIAGPLYGMWIGRRVVPEPPARLVEQFEHEDRASTVLAAEEGAAATHRPTGDSLGRPAAPAATSVSSFGVTLATILLPVVLMLGKALVDVLVHGRSPAKSVLDFIGDPLLALAIGAGSLFFSHVNDAGFWLVKEYFGMSVGQTVATWSVMETILSTVGIVLILAVGLVL